MARDESLPQMGSVLCTGRTRTTKSRSSHRHWQFGADVQISSDLKHVATTDHEFTGADTFLQMQGLLGVVAVPKAWPRACNDVLQAGESLPARCYCSQVPRAPVLPCSSQSRPRGRCSPQPSISTNQANRTPEPPALQYLSRDQKILDQHSFSSDQTTTVLSKCCSTRTLPLYVLTCPLSDLYRSN